ncbi:MAG: TauD/TfdA family dioxygenase [Pseudomonadales bacterium]|nr:TauD/TfdA family dioxygenase [Pseudomonadales bacterium]
MAGPYTPERDTPEKAIPKRLSRATLMGMTAAARYPDLGDRKTMAQGIKAQDADLVTGSLAPVTYKPVSVCGVDLKLEPLSPALGTVIHGIDLDQDLDQVGIVEFLRALWLERRVIMFRDQQHLSRDGLIRFARCFGELGAHHGERDHVPSGPQTPQDYPDVLQIRSEENHPNAASEWHSDATWSSRPPMGSVLICREAPPVGGDTNFCDGYGLWQGVHRATKERIKALKAVHVGQPHHAMDGHLPKAIHPVARTHPETGRTVLFVNRVFTRQFADEHDLSEAETQNLLQELFANIGRPEVTCRFRWRQGSVAMWDNRAVQHCATADFWPHRRLMERVTILDSDVAQRTPYFTG